MRPVIFVDTDVTLDLLLCRHPFVKDAKRQFVLVETGKVETCSTPIILANTFYLLRKQHPAESVKSCRVGKLFLPTVPSTAWAR